MKSKIVGETHNSILKDPKRNLMQQKAIQGSLSNKINFIWGPPGTGKTSTLGYIAYNLIKQNKKILFATNTNRAVDVAVLGVIETFKYFNDDKFDKITRYGRPFLQNNPELDFVFFDNQIEEVRKERREKIKEELQLWRSYKEIKVKISLHEEYLKNLNLLKKEIKDEQEELNIILQLLQQIKHKIENYHKVGVFESLTRLFIGDSLDDLKKQFSNKRQEGIQLKNLLSDKKQEYDKMFSECPISKEEFQSYNSLKGKVKEFGGEEELKDFIDKELEVNEAAILKTKSFLAATLAKIVTNDVFFELDCDVLIVDEASMVNLPYLAVLSSLVNKSIIVVGDPQQLPPISLSSSSVSKKWLQKDIFMYASQSIEIEDLFEWHDSNTEYTHFLDTQYRMTGKLCDVISNAFYNGRLKNGKKTENNSLAGICFIDTSSLHPTLNHLSGKKKFAPYNTIHTERVIEILKYLAINNLFKPEEIGIVVPFKASVQWIRKELRKEGLKAVEVGTVHTFQGREKPFIIFDTVMSGVNYTVRPFDEAKTGEEVKRLLNVALSPPQDTVFVISNMTHFSNIYKGKIINNVLNTLRNNSEVNLNIENAVKQFDELSIDEQEQLISELLDDDEIKENKETATLEHKNIQNVTIEKSIETPPNSYIDKQIMKQLHKYGNEIIALRFEINSLSSRLNNKTLFKPSIESEKITGILPSFVADNEDDFKNWIDMMYKYFYESSGGKNAKFPIVDRSNDKSKIRWEINILRNDFFHDSEHSDSKKFKQKQVQNIYETYIGKNYPTKNSEWINVQLGIMFKITEWLKQVSRKLVM